MADAVDMAVEIEAEHLARGLRRATAPVPAGVAGECDDCGEIMPRLVGGRCGFCRDGRVPPPDWVPPTIENTASREDSMPESKSVTFVATGDVLAELKRLTKDGTSNNRAALDLVEAGLAAQRASAVSEEPVPSAAATLADFDIYSLMSEIGRQYDEALEGGARSAELAAAIMRADEAEARAAAAEAKLASLREALAA